MAETPVTALSDQDLVREVGERFFGHADAQGRVLWQAAMSRELGISQSMLSAIVRGQRGLTLQMRARLAAWARAEIPREQDRRVRRKDLLKSMRDRWQ